MAISTIPQSAEPLVKAFLAGGGLPGNAGFHNSIYRGKYLGASVTAAQYAAISAGTFDDLFIGDYWTINGVDWVIADFDTKYNSAALSPHHICVIPKMGLYKTRWNETDNTLTGGVNGGAGYIDSYIRANIKSGTNGEAEGAELKAIAAFGSSHVKAFDDVYPTSYSGQIATGWSWVTGKVELMCEFDVYGGNIVSGSYFEVGSSKHQLAIFRLYPDFATLPLDWWWLRSVSTAASGHVALVSPSGHALEGGAGDEHLVRPLVFVG